MDAKRINLQEINLESLELLGGGLEGQAYRYNEELVVKVTSQHSYYLFKAFIGYDPVNLVKVYQCAERASDYLVLREYVEMGKKELKRSFVSKFFDSWRKSLKYNPANMGSESPLVMLRNSVCIGNANVECALDIFRKNGCSEEEESMFHGTCQAIREIYVTAPYALIDIKPANFGFAKDGTIKYFDWS